MEASDKIIHGKRGDHRVHRYYGRALFNDALDVLLFLPTLIQLGIHTLQIFGFDILD